MSAVRFEARTFDSLAPRTLYELLALRARIFVVEQRCAYLDPDGLDPEALHVLGWRDRELVACARILAPGVKYPDEHAIGRVCIAPTARGRGLARTLMQESMRAIDRRRAAGIALSAQAHLEPFYASLGFVRRGDVYLEDDIPHVEMALPRTDDPR